MLKKYFPISFVFLSILVVFVFQNCGQTPRSLMGDALPFASSESTAVYDKNCLQTTSYDACVFLKNPTNTRAAVLNNYTMDTLSSEQAYAVQLTF